MYIHTGDNNFKIQLQNTRVSKDPIKRRLRIKICQVKVEPREAAYELKPINYNYRENNTFSNIRMI